MPNQTKSKNRVTLGKIAEMAGVSKCAVSLALKGSRKISEAVRRKIKRIADANGYRGSALLSTVMSNIKTGRSCDFLETIVLINANRSKDAPKRFPIFEKYINGIMAEASHLGYSVYSVWLHDEKLTQQRLKKILVSRGIRGGVIIGHADDTILPERFSQIWRDFKFVSAGLRTFNPTLDFISPDKFLIAQYATAQIIKKGYRRPAIVLDAHIDEIVEGRFIGGFLRAQLALPEKSRISPFLDVARAKKKNEIFIDWVKKNKPDVIFSVSNATAEWLDEIYTKLPNSVEIVRLERNSIGEGWVGIDTNYELVGRLAVRKLFDILNTRAGMGDIDVSTCTIVEPHWNKNLVLERIPPRGKLPRGSKR